MEWTGGCLCGAVRFRTDSDPLWVGHCHCEMCRRQTGGVMGSFVAFPAGSVEWLGKEPQRYRSSEHVERGFCPTCGSTLTFQRIHETAIAVGALDHPETLTPGHAPAGSAIDCHVFFEQRIPWLEIADNLVRHERWPAERIAELEDLSPGATNVDGKSGEAVPT